MKYLMELAEQIRAEVEPATLPEGQIDGLLLSYAVLALALGTSVTTEDVHNAWVSWMTNQDPSHPSLVPFPDLDPETASQDVPFAEAIRRAVLRNLAKVPGENQYGR